MPQTYIDEATLINQARQHDQVAWEHLVRSHQQAVFRLAYLLLGQADEAEDVAQETFIRAFRFLHQFDSNRSLQPWLLKITTNLARNRRRSLGRYAAMLQRFLQSGPEPVLRPHLNEQISTWEANTLWQAVQGLSFKDQQIIYLRYFMALSVSETASVLDVAQGTVKSRLYRALDRLKQVVEQKYPDLAAEWGKETVLNDE